MKCTNFHNIDDTCVADEKYCGNCGEKGHFSRSELCPNRNPRDHMARQRAASHRYRARAGARTSRGTGRDTRVHYMDTNYDPGAYYQYDSDDYQYDEYEDENTSAEYDDMSQMFDEQCTVYDAYMVNTNTDSNKNTTDWVVNMEVEDKNINFEIDTGAMCNIVSLKTLKNLKLDHRIEHSSVLINDVHGKISKAYGKIQLECKYREVQHRIEFQVLDTNKEVNLLGRKSSVDFNLIARVYSVHKTECEELLRKYKDAFDGTVGCIPGEFNITVDPNVEPVISPPRPVPAPLRAKVKQELDHLEKSGIIAKVTKPTQWVNPMVCVSKPNDRVRICIDPSQLNKAVHREHYPLNTLEDIVTRVKGSQHFTKLDCNMGFFHLKLTEKSTYYTTFNTPFGRYRHLRLPMGLSSSPEIYQRAMMNIFGDIEGCEVLMDDILIHGPTLEIHNKRLEETFQRARHSNIKLNRAKTKVAQPEVTYLGHTITKDGLKPTPERVRSIIELKEPENWSELESVLGMITYVGKFIPNLSQMNAPLRELKKSDVWYWGLEQKDAFQKIKNTLSSEPVLQYYDVNAPILLTVDSSSKGMGIAAIQSNGVVAYASRALTPTEQRYAQIEKEMLAIVFACQRFHTLIYGKQDVTIESDHKPLETLLRKPIHAAPMRIQRMLLKLQPYTFKLIWTKGTSIGLADCLSRLSLQRGPKPNETMDEELMVCKVDTLAHSKHEKIAKATDEDDELQTVKEFILRGWPENRKLVPKNASLYYDYRDEMSTYNNIVYRGDRICIPKSIRQETLKTVHTSHMGMVKTKQLARDIVFWPGMNSQIEDMISKCAICLEHKNKNAKEPMIIHEIPNQPWSKVGSDLFELGNNSYMVMVDYYSGYIEIDKLPNTTSNTIIKCMKAQIARHGIMDILITDGGPQYSSQTFREFTREYGIQHNISSPEHQQSNGLAEQAVKTMKNLIKKTQQDGTDFYLALLQLRNTPRDTTLGSPVQRLMNRRTQTQLPTAKPLLKPQVIQPKTVQNQLMRYRLKQKHYYDRNTKPLTDIKPDQAIRVHTRDGWKPAQYINQHQMPRSYIVKAGPQARHYRRNRKFLMNTAESPHTIRPQYIPLPRMPTRAIPQQQPNNTHPQHPDRPTQPNPVQPPNTQTTTRAGRIVRKPVWLEDYYT